MGLPLGMPIDAVNNANLFGCKNRELKLDTPGMFDNMNVEPSWFSFLLFSVEVVEVVDPKTWGFCECARFNNRNLRGEERMLHRHF